MEPPAKRLCISQGPDLQLESAKNTECEESDCDCQQERTSSTSTATSASTSSSKQSRQFRKVWLTGREDWLEFSWHDRGMFCSLCRKFNKRPFNNDIWNTSPCTRLRLQSILRHERSFAHKDAIQLAAAAATNENVVSILNRPVSARGMEQAICCLYFLAKRKIAQTTNYDPLLDLVSLLGIHIKSKISIANNATYTSDKTIQDMVYIISDVIEKQILSEMTKSGHFSLMLDETTDCSVAEQLAIHGRYISPTTGELKCHYLKVIDLLYSSHNVSAGAETITSRVCDYIEQAASVDMTKLRGIGTDGAATMVGCHTGVVTRLQAIQPSAIGVHCAADRLNLDSSQAGDNVQYIKHFKSILHQLFDFYDNSAVRMAGLDAIKCEVCV